MRCSSLVGAAVLFLSSFAVHAVDDITKDFNCEEFLLGTLVAESADVKSSVDQEVAVINERRNLVDMISADPKVNLAVRAPFIVMNAAQRISTLMRSQGTENVRLPGARQDVIIYNLVSKGTDASNGKRVVGQEGSIETIADNVDAQANGDRASVSVPLQIGSAGSGKSEMIQVWREAFDKLTTPLESPYAIWTFEWKNLHDIPEVTSANFRAEQPGSVIPAALDDSPILLLPEKMQKAVLANAKEAVSKISGGRFVPQPFPYLNIQDQTIRLKILEHYQKQKGSPLTEPEVMNALNKHVSLKRVLWNATSGALPVVDYQGENEDIAGLFVSPNAIVRVTRGPSDPFAYDPAKILKGHGNAVFFDEFLQNPESLLKFFLRVFQERKVAVGGSPDYPLDTVILAASNASTLARIQENPDNAPFLNRFLMIEMPWPTQPSGITQILLYNYQGKLLQQKLPGLNGDTNDLGPIEPAKMDEVFPLNMPPSQTGPDYRYKLIIRQGETEVKFSPHALRFISYMVAASRMETDVSKAIEVMPQSKVTRLRIFKDPITRIRFEEGQISDITGSETDDLRKLSALLNEGSNGISSRDAGRWLSKVVQEAKRPENRNTITPNLIMSIFDDMLDRKKSLKAPDNKTRLMWKSLIFQVATQLIAPRIEQDISLASASDQTTVRNAYYEIFGELSALYNDKDAKTFHSPTFNQEKNIDQERLNAVRQIFLKNQGRELDTAQIAMYHDKLRRESTVGHENDVVHPGLMQAVIQYYASMATRLVQVQEADLAKYADTGEGNGEVRSVFQTVVDNLKKIGYDETSARQALSFLGRLRALGGQAQ